ncbi:T9SS type A sorting domain-containing protein [Lishizhenia sp.]|uniref:T9SS type A sorting domain-containing protein n=1 Tax=Lishizhenia sp. TaxID=2497594 RepID=UPI00299D7B54|nr:T9SS type A sorting domain-containing protein [Lishizhenia sp.]MDX1447048.1 T9SS type A sorting domain-containing protein [Lishizhenia sp.]
MKKIYNILGCLLLTTLSFGQWQVPAGNPYFYGELSYPAIDTAYITGTTGELYQSLDGGENWSIIQQFGGFSSLHKPQFINGKLGFVNANGGVYRTSDAGVTWDTISADWINQTGLPFNDIVIGDDYVYAYYQDNGAMQIIRSADYGDTWTNLVLLPFTAYTMTLDLWEDTYGLILDPNYHEKYYYSTDGFVTVDTVFTQNFQEVIGGGRLEMVNSALAVNYRQFGGTGPSQRIQASSGYVYDLNLDGFNVLPVIDLDQQFGKLIASSYYGKYFICINTHATQWIEYNVGVDAPIYNMDFADEDHAIALVGNELRYTKNASTLGTTFQEEIDFKVYPNPFESVLNLDSENKDASFRLYDVQGNLVHTMNTSGQHNLDFLHSGVYLLEIRDGVQKNYQKVIKK